jgi:putative copper resistance protein D
LPVEPLALVRALHFAAALSLAGALLFDVAVAKGARSAWLAYGSLALAFATTLAWLLMFTASLVEESAQFPLWSVLTETRFGWIWITRFVLLALCTGLLIRRWRMPALAAAAGALILLAAVGHSGATPGAAGWLYLGNDMLHLLAGAAWLGGLLPLAFYLRATGAAQARMAARRFSVLGIISVGVLLASGILNSWNLVGSFDALWISSYGELVAFKIFVFVVMVAIAAVNRYGLTPRLSGRVARRALRINTMIEAAIGALALFAVGVLGMTPPAAHWHMPQISSADAAFVHIHGGRAMAEVTIRPGQSGTTAIWLQLMQDDMSPLAAPAVTMTLQHPQSAPVTVPLQSVDTGEWGAAEVVLPAPGIWTAIIAVTLPDGSTEVLDGPIVIELPHAQ